MTISGICLSDRQHLPDFIMEEISLANVFYSKEYEKYMKANNEI